MAANTIRLADLSPEPTIVELGESKYEVQAVTRSVQKKLEVAMKALDAAEKDEDTDADKTMAALVNAMDVLLSPVGSSTPAAKKVLTDAWKADQLSAAQMGGLFDRVNEAASSRPT